MAGRILGISTDGHSTRINGSDFWLPVIHGEVKKKVETADDGTPFELTTELVMLRALERGLTLRDFEDLTFGMITGYIIAYNNERLDGDDKEDNVRTAVQADFDRF